MENGEKRMPKDSQKTQKNPKKKSKKSTEKTHSDDFEINPPRASVEKKQRAVSRGVNQDNYLKSSCRRSRGTLQIVTFITFLKESASRNPPRQIHGGE